MRIPFFSEKRARRSVAVFFALLALLGALMIDDYGVPCDEQAEQVILQENLKEYAARLGNGEAVRYYDAIGVARISESVERDHGQAAYYLAAPLLQIGDGWMRSVLWRLYTWCWFMAGVCALYALCRTLNVGYLLSCAASLMLYLAPRLFAEGHYNNRDAVLLSLALATLALGARFLCSPTWRRAMLFSLAGALAANARIAGLWAWVLIYVFALLRAVVRRKLDRDTRIGLTTAPISLLLVYAALTPALWAGPWAYLGYLVGNAAGCSRWTGVVLFQGIKYNVSRGQPLPRWYLPYMIGVTTPLVYLLLMVVGQFRACVAWKRAKGQRLTDERVVLLLVLTLFWVVPLGYAVLCRPLMYNGWRHFYFLYAGLCALGGFGMQSLAEAMRKAEAGRAICAFAVCCCFLYYGYGIVRNHPFQYAYYNSLMSASDVEKDYELDYWDVSTVNALRRLCTGDRDPQLALTVAGTDDMSAFGVEHAYAALPQGFKALLTLADDPSEASYLFANTTYARIYEVAPPEGYRPLFRLKSYGREICVVYERIVE